MRDTELSQTRYTAVDSRRLASKSGPGGKWLCEGAPSSERNIGHPRILPMHQAITTDEDSSRLSEKHR